ncbi:MAG: SsrA-binding protein SmpB [Candidatus Moraniibacteriota bacterium]
MGTLAINKRASFDYFLLNEYEAGLVLSGQEVKSARLGQVSLKESFVTLKANELYLTNAYIAPYKQAGLKQINDPTRSRKLLLRKSEIRQLIGKVRTEGLTLVPLKIYTKKRLLKLSFAVAKGKKKFDKRETIAKKEVTRDIQRALKNN